VDEVFSSLPFSARAAINPAPRIDAVSLEQKEPGEPEEEDFPLMSKEPSLL
jgi:hypothetical protein